ncbi:uncharacterized protein LOC129178769 isoform X2 [Dunckerocampus dactyliophorus]|uniref:uncharacterized protein LOC129178769 isoform X2 n=1 Tax=Dunckerocampus dactyliophorus TaxID=161453 RepID=UPI0024049BA6|nr:uncharacterized protein LOC129178769 isoform X2 [Dunckerocampus dactyliophorus]
MEEDLEHFLHSREVPNEDIMRMKRDKMHHRTAHGPRQPEPSQSTPTDQRQGTNRSFPDPWSETIELTSTSLSHSLQTEHEHIYRVASEDTELDEADTVLWDPEDNLGNEENVVITYHLVDSEDVTQSPEVNAVLNQELCLPSADGLTTLDEQSIHELGLAKFMQIKPS